LGELKKYISLKKIFFNFQGAPTESPDGSGMYPPPNFNASMSASQLYQQPQSYYGNQSQQSQANQQQKKSPQSQQQQSQQSMPPPQSQQQLTAQQQQGHQMMQHQMTGGHHMDSNQYGGMSHNPAYMNQVINIMARRTYL